MNELKAYLKSLKVDENEHSNRSPLETLFKPYVDNLSAIITHEPKANDDGKKADFKITYNNFDVGLIETKKIGLDLDSLIESDQINNYNNQCKNIIITDYLRFIWLYDKKIVKDVTLCNVADFPKPKVKLATFTKLDELIKGFLLYTPASITHRKMLAERLVLPTRDIKDGIESLLNQKNRILVTIKETFTSGLGKDLSNKEFADATAQTFSYALFLAKLNQARDEKLNITSLDDYIPKAFPLLIELISDLRKLRNEKELQSAFETLLYIINLIDSVAIKTSLKFNKVDEDDDKDPYIHFYEDFLTAYDPKTRKDFGAYYTPKPVVKAIVDNINNLLKKDFGLADGFADANVKTLDFATGTGTFMLEVFEAVFSALDPNSTDMAKYRKNMLNNVYGFEVQIAPYAVASLKLSEYINDVTGVAIDIEKENLKVYLTNTLNDVNIRGNLGFGEFGRQAVEAMQIKTSQPIMVILGNPPYNVKSLNKLASGGNLEAFHNNYKPSSEKNINSLSDDYIKFIAFAHQKIENTDKGIFGLVVNKSFLSGITHRKMRGELLKTFNQIYIIDMVDQNVFDIKQEVCIALFVKNPASTKNGLFYKELGGRRSDKFKLLKEIDVLGKLENWDKLDIASFNKQFTKTPWGKEVGEDLNFFYPMATEWLKKYGSYIGLGKIFKEYMSGVATESDRKYINFKPSFERLTDDDSSLDDIDLTIDNFDKTKVKEIAYRAFDKRYCYYDTKLLGRARESIMQHMINHDNIGLVFMRGYTGTKIFNQIFIANGLLDKSFYGYNSYLAPLYINHDDDKKELGKEFAKDTNQKSGYHANFTAEFETILAKSYPNASVQQVFAYIYAIMYHPSYRTAYNNLLKIDYPRIPFNLAEETFSQLAKLGQKLIDLHLLKFENRVVSRSFFKEGEAKNYMVEDIKYIANEQVFYLNKSLYFKNVSKEMYGFTIGGYAVIANYFTGGKNSRKKNKVVLDSDDIDHINKFLQAIEETLQVSSLLETITI